jgi:hypothetical protein
VSPIQKNEAKDLSSIKAVTTRAFDILSANSNVQNLIFATGLLNQKIYAYTAHSRPIKWMLFFNIGYEAAKNRSKTKFIKFNSILEKENSIFARINNTHMKYKEFF